MVQILKISFFSLFLLFFAFSALAANPLDVVINEIAWMGTAVSYNDEWIELRNNTSQKIDLDGWILKAVDGTPEIKLTGNVLVNGFYLLERTDDNTVPNVAADQIYTGALGNSGEKLELYDNGGDLIDSIDASAGWPAGGNTTKQTMERTESSWQTSRNPGGTPKSKNSVTIQIPPQPPEEPIMEPEPIEEPQQELVEVKPQRVQQITYPVGVMINEILPSPTGADEEEEWIEIFNQNNFGVDLSGWQIQDVTGSTKTYTFPESTVIGPLGFLVLSRPITKITLNNGGDGLKLLRPNGNVINETSYDSAPRNESYSRFETDWTWTAVPTPGLSNALSASTLEPEKKTAEKGSPRTELAAIASKNSNSLFVYLAATFTSLSGGVMILILKRKMHVRT